MKITTRIKKKIDDFKKNKRISREIKIFKKETFNYFKRIALYKSDMLKKKLKYNFELAFIYIFSVKIDFLGNEIVLTKDNRTRSGIMMWVLSIPNSVCKIGKTIEECCDNMYKYMNI